MLVSITVTAVNDAPIANADSATTKKNTAVTTTVLANDVDPDGDVMTVTGRTMRENLRKYRQMSLREVIDRSINETLGRSLYTSVTAFLSLLPMAIWVEETVSGKNAICPISVPAAVKSSEDLFVMLPTILSLHRHR